MPKTWFITGCTSGFGNQLVRQVLARGDKVITGARDATRRAGALVDLGAHVIDLDLTWDHVLIEKIVRQAIDDCGAVVDYLISVAGYGFFGAFEEISQMRLLESLQVNLHGHINVTRAILPYMRAKRAGKIAVISSEAGWTGIQGWSAYCIAKFGLEGFIGCLSLEVAPLGIETLLIEPGGHRTGFGIHFDRDRQPHYPVYDSVHQEVHELPKLLTEGPGNPEIAAKRMIETLTGTGLATGKRFPPRLPLGKDSLQGIRRKCIDTLSLLEEWEPVIVSTDDRPVAPFPYPIGDNEIPLKNGALKNGVGKLSLED